MRIREISKWMGVMLACGALFLWSCTKDEVFSVQNVQNEQEETEPEEEEPSPMEQEWDRIYDERNLSAETFTYLNLSGIDELGRVTIPSTGDKEKKYVGIFYFVWCGAHDVNQYDINWLEENNPYALWASTDASSVRGLYHYWGKPLYGYYHQLDEWVVTRHVELLTNAGIDFLGIDVTNGTNWTYDSQVGLLLSVLLKFQRQGFKVPQVMFLTNSNSAKVISHLNDLWYSDSDYEGLWFAPNGKPMVAGTTSWSSEYDSVMAGFDVKYCQWPNVDRQSDGFAWMEWSFPQPLYPDTKEMSVSIAQHISGKMSLQTSNWGRSYSHTNGLNNESRVNEGLNYQEQWETAHATEGAEIVFVTGWNEWQAIKTVDNGGVYFVDTFNTNYSRDIEMMEGGYDDCYYMQTVMNVRQFKGEAFYHYFIDQYTIDIDGDLSQWDNVKYVYRDFQGDAIARNHEGSISGYTYVDDSNRNDIVTVKVATDEEYAYFYVKTAADITEYVSGTNWMNILIGANEQTGFECYDYLINAAPAGDSTSVSKFTGNGFKYEDVGTADLRVDGAVMQVRVALSTIGVNPEEPYFTFKVCDNVTNQSDMMDYYISGDCAPLGRLSYTYGY